MMTRMLKMEVLCPDEVSNLFDPTPSILRPSIHATTHWTNPIPLANPEELL